MVTRADLVQIAREWLGTPYHHQAAVKGAGCDCIGLIRGVTAEAGLYPKNTGSIPGAAKYRGYGRIPEGDMLLRAAREFMIETPVADVQVGDVLLFRMNTRLPQHFAFVAHHPECGPSIIHAINLPGMPTGIVKEERLHGWRPRIVGAFRIPGLDD